MYRIISFAVFTLLFYGCSDAQTKKETRTQTNPTVVEQSEVINKVVDAETFKKLLSEKKNAQLIDVRTREEVSRGYIEGATNINYMAPGFKEKLSKLDKNAPVFVYCAVGGRSGRAARMMKDMGFKEVYDLRGGYNGWPYK